MSDLVGLPKAEVVARTLEREIRQGRMAHGAQLDSEGGLMRRFDVSRNTVRRGLEILTRQGLITTRTGIGSFVTYGGTRIDSAAGWTVALSHGAEPVETRVLIFAHRQGADGAVLQLDRLRLVGDVGISLERSRMPWRPGFDTLLAKGLPEGSLSRGLAALGLFAARGQEEVGVEAALSAADAAIMGRRPGTAMLRLERRMFLPDGSLLERVESLLDPGRFGLRIDF